MLERTEALNYKICTKCIMDSSDPEAIFDDEGVCSYCRKHADFRLFWDPQKDRTADLSEICALIRQNGKNSQYDCILGLSGGVDSSYVALKIKQFGLRPLIIHVDGGWNSELAVSNIQRLVDYLGCDLFTHVVDWMEMRDLQLAYLKSGIANQDVPQDHVFFSVLYKLASKHKIKYIISGSNYATESIFPERFFGNAMDSKNLNAIHRKFGTSKLNTYTRISFYEYYIKYPRIKKIRTIKPLNYLIYDKMKAMNELIKEIGYKPYARKHGESIFTKFYQNHYLPEKYNFDKRRLHLSSMILSNQISRKIALQTIKEPLYEPKELQSDIVFVARKLDIQTDELLSFVHNTKKSSYYDFPNWEKNYFRLRSLYRTSKRLTGQH